MICDIYYADTSVQDVVKYHSASFEKILKVPSPLVYTIDITLQDGFAVMNSLVNNSFTEFEGKKHYSFDLICY